MTTDKYPLIVNWIQHKAEQSLEIIRIHKARIKNYPKDKEVLKDSGEIVLKLEGRLEAYEGIIEHINMGSKLSKYKRQKVKK